MVLRGLILYQIYWQFFEKGSDIELEISNSRFVETFPGGSTYFKVVKHDQIRKSQSNKYPK